MNIKNLFRPSYFKITVVISILFTVVYRISPSLFELLELKTVDIRFKNRPAIAHGKEVIIATIDAGRPCQEGVSYGA